MRAAFGIGRPEKTLRHLMKKPPYGNDRTRAFAAPAAARTRDPKLRRLVLYPTELPEQCSATILPAAVCFGKLYLPDAV